jgi:invasion protein IalB
MTLSMVGDKVVIAMITTHSAFSGKLNRWGTQRNLPAFRSIALLLLALITSTPAVSQSVRETKRVFQDWQEGCEGSSDSNEVCFIFQRLSYQDRPAANIMVGFKQPQAKPMAVINLPLGAVLLPDGLRIKIDKGVDGWAPFRFCDKLGCHVEIEIDDKLFLAMKAGLNGVLAFKDLNGREIEVPLSLRGFTAGLTAIKR